MSPTLLRTMVTHQKSKRKLPHLNLCTQYLQYTWHGRFFYASHGCSLGSMYSHTTYKSNGFEHFLFLSTLLHASTQNATSMLMNHSFHILSPCCRSKLYDCNSWNLLARNNMSCITSWHIHDGVLVGKCTKFQSILHDVWSVSSKSNI